MTFGPKHAKPDTIEHGRDYSDDELEFLKACDKYRSGKRMNCLDATDYFYILTKKLGYKKNESQRIFE